MKKIIIVLIAVLFIPKIYAACDSTVKCDTSVGGFLGIGSKKCKGLSPLKIYTYDDEIYGFCYYSSEYGGYFYEVRNGDKNCKSVWDAAFAYKNKQGSLAVTQKASEQVNVISKGKMNGCAPYFTVTAKYGYSFSFWYEEPTDNKWVKAETVGKVTSDEETYKSVSSCVSNTLQKSIDNFCSSSNKDEIYANAIDTCIKNNTDYTEEMFETYKNKLKEEFKKGKKAETYLLICKLKEKCNIKTNDALKFTLDKYVLEDKGKNSNVAATEAAEGVFKNNSEAKKCVINNSELSSSEEKTQSDMETSAETQIDTSVQRVEEAMNQIRGEYTIPWHKIKPNTLTCEELIGENMYKIVHFIITSLRIIGAIIAIVNGMISLIPALVAKDGDSLKAAQKKCINMAIVLVLIILLPTLLTFIGKMFNYDLSCIL